jgi:hypothetical protein
MDEITKKGPERGDTPGPNDITRTSVRKHRERSKLLVVLFDGYAKLYCDHPLSLHVAVIPSVETADAELAALTDAESRIPKLWQHLIDERLLQGAISTRVPSAQAWQESEGLLFGLHAIDEAARRSIANKRAARRVQQ